MKKFVAKMPNPKQLIILSVLLVIVSLGALTYTSYSNVKHENARFKAEQQALLKAKDNNEHTKQSSTAETTPQVSPTPQTTQTNQSSTPAKSTFDCVAYNNSQRSIWVQAGDALYAVYTSQKAYILGPSSEYSTWTDDQKQAPITSAYLTYEQKMDINNNKYLQDLSSAGHNCYTYYQKIPYAAR